MDGVGLGPEALIRENHRVNCVAGPRAGRPGGTQEGIGHGNRGIESRGDNMAAMKPRTGDGPLEVTKEGRGIVMRVPLEGGGRLVVEMTPDEASELGEALKSVAG